MSDASAPLPSEDGPRPGPPPVVPPAPERISRIHLDALRRLSRSIPEPVEPDVLAELEAIGALVDGVCHPALAGPAAVLNAVSSTLHVRRWYRGDRAHLSGFLGPAGLAVLLGPLEADAPVKVVHRPRTTSTPRLIGSFVGLGPTRHADVVLPSRLPWDEVLATTGPERPTWVDDIVPASVDPVVWDLSWQATPDVSPSNVLNVVSFGGEVLAEVRAVDRRDPSAGFRLVPRSPGAVWWALCRIVRGSGADPPPGPALDVTARQPTGALTDDPDAGEATDGGPGATPITRGPWPTPSTPT